MQITFSNNPIDRVLDWFNNSVVTPVSRFYYSKKKAHYKCAICDIIEAPYFTGFKFASLTHDLGWHKLDSGKWHRWVCHHCVDHGFKRSGAECSWGFTWDSWQDYVQEENEKTLAIIKEKDPEYYEYWLGDE